MTTYYEVCVRWHDRLAGRTQLKQLKTPRVFASDDGDTIYSYGRHFPMAIALRDKQRQVRALLLNGDRVSPSTTQQQSTLRSALTGAPWPVVIIPFSALEAAGISKDSIEIVEVTADRVETRKHVTYSQPEGSIWREVNITQRQSKPPEMLQAICDKINDKRMAEWEQRHEYSRQELRDHPFVVDLCHAERELKRQAAGLSYFRHRHKHRYWTNWVTYDSVDSYPREYTVDEIHEYEREHTVVIGTKQVLFRSASKYAGVITVEQAEDGRIRHSWETTHHWLGESVFRGRVRVNGSTPCKSCKGTGQGVGPDLPPGWVLRDSPGHHEGRWRNENVSCATCHGNRRTFWTKDRTVTFLSGFDHQEPRPLYFLCELPKVTVTTVAQAYEALKPSTVKMAEQMGREVKRQGDIFALPVPGLDKRSLRKQGATFAKRGTLLATNHVATEVAYLPNGVTLARGILTHDPSGRQPDHVRKPLGKVWHITLKNTVPISV